MSEVNTLAIKIKDKKEITDDFLLMQGQDLFDNAKTGHQLFFERMRKDMDLYDGKFQTDERKYSDVLGIPRLFIPKTYVNTHRILVDVLQAVHADPNEIVDIVADKSIPTEYQKIVKTLMNHRLNGHPISFYQEAYEGALNAIRNMIGIFKVWPEVETEEVTVQKLREKTLEDGTPYQTYVDEKEEHIKYFEPHMECIPPEDVFFSKRATWKNYYKYPMVHRYKRTRNELKLMGYKNVDQLAEVQLEDQLVDVVKYQRRQDYQTLFNDNQNVKDQEEIYVFECWDFMPSGDDGKIKSGSYILLGDMLKPNVVGRGWVENDLPYRFSPFEHNRPPIILGEAYPEPHRLEGKSYGQITEALQKETNAQRNQEREAIARDLRRTMYINRDANVDLVGLTNRRIGGYVLGDGPRDEAIGEIPTNNSAAILARTQGRTDSDYYEAGLPPNMLGSGAGSDTATESSQQLSNANKKVELVVKNLVYTLFLPALKFLLRLEQAYETEDYINKVTGKHLGWKVGNPARDAIQGDFDIQVNLAINKQSQINKILMVADRLNQTNQATAQLLQIGAIQAQNAAFGDPMKVFEQLLPLVGIPKIDEFKLPAMQPPVQPEGGPGGNPSPPAPMLDATSQVSNMSPAAPGMVGG